MTDQTKPNDPVQPVDSAKPVDSTPPNDSLPGGLWRPRSSREGIGPLKYIWWNSFYAIMEYFNRALARDPNRKVSWDKWPHFLGLLYLIAKIRFNRSNALTDPYDYAANDTRRFLHEPKAVRRYYTADGTWDSDKDNPQMGATNTRFGSNIPPKYVRPDVEEMTPSAREAGKLRWRAIDKETGKEIVKPALILSDLAGWWILFEAHSFVGFTERDPLSKCPMHLKRRPDENWPNNEAVLDRTTVDPTRVSHNGRPTVRNTRSQVWSQAQTYGTNKKEQDALRTFVDGKLKLDDRGYLPEDPAKPGIDQTGFNNNYTPGLSLLHWLFVMEHNAVCDHHKFFHPDWDDETLFQEARKDVLAEVARIHTIQWTKDLLQHPVLQTAMDADWNGLIGRRKKMFLMRFFHRHPRISKWMTWFRNNEFLWGMAGGKWEHHDGPYQVPTQFRLVYRLHEMVLSQHEIFEPSSDRLLGRYELIDFVAHNTRPIVEKFGYEALAWSFVKKSCGALALHNFPLALTKFNNQQDGALTDLAERDLFRERTDGSGTYNDFRRSVGEPPVTSFMELTGGDAELAKEIELKYAGDVDAVDAGIGILCEPKPEGFALGFCQFYQFVLNAPRRVKSNRHLTEGWNYEGYGEGLNWVEHGGGMQGILRRHLPALRPRLEGVVRAFAPWRDIETFPRDMLEKTGADTGAVFKSDVRTFGLAAAALGTAVFTGAASPLTAALALGAMAVIPCGIAVKRMLAMRFMQQVWKKCYTDKRGFMFGTLTRAEQWINRAAFVGRAWSLATIGGAAVGALATFGAHPILAGLFGLVSLSGVPSFKQSKTFAADAQVLKVSLRNRMRSGQPLTDAATLPGDTALAKRYWFLKGDNVKPVATFSTCFRQLRDSGLPSWTAFSTAVLSLVGFGRKTQNGLTSEQKTELGLGFFDIHIPNLAQAMGESATRIYARAGNAQGLKAGDVDGQEFERTFRMFAPGRDYLTAYDFARMREGNALRDAAEGRGNCVSRFIGRLAAKRRHDQLMLLFSDLVVDENDELVPAITKETMWRFYHGAAQQDLLREHIEGDLDPSPPAGLKQLAGLESPSLERLYRRCQAAGKAAGGATALPDGQSRGRAIVLPGTITGSIISAICNSIWKGKVFYGQGDLVNRILGMHLVRAKVFAGESWSDGKEAVIIDYKRTSWLAFFIRDEIREVQPGLWLGKAYVRLPFGKRFPALYFALDFREE